MQREGSHEWRARLGEIGMLVVQQHLLQRGFNVAVPVVQDQTDLVIYDKDICLQAQVKAVRTDYVDLREPSPRRKRTHQERYQYVDVFAFCCLETSRIWMVPSNILRGRGQLKIRSYPTITADVLRLPTNTCEGGHSCTAVCPECTSYLDAVSASDRPGVEAMLSRSLSPGSGRHAANRKATLTGTKK